MHMVNVWLAAGKDDSEVGWCCCRLSCRVLESQVGWFS